MRTHAFKVVVEPDDDRWHAYCPAFSAWAAATWGDTEEEAFQNIQGVVQMIVEGMIEDGIAVPTEGAESLEIGADGAYSTALLTGEYLATAYSDEGSFP